MAREQERLDPVPGAEVERALDRLADGQVGEHGRGSVDACDAVRAVDVEPVGRDQEVVVRDDAGEPVQQAVALLGEPCLDQQRRELVRRRGSPRRRSEISSERRSGTAASRRRYTSRSTCVKIGSPLVCRRRAIPAPV